MAAPPLYSPKNEYIGINAHLQSMLQQENGDWQSFHAGHIIDLLRFVDRGLPPGYYASAESSMQIKTQSIPDVTIIHQATPTSELQRTSTPVAVMEEVDTEVYAATLERLEEEEEYFRAVMIYQRRAEMADRPVTRIELLSPANKASGTHHEQYENKRRETLLAGIHIVEIDYLHQSAPIRSLQDYVPNYAVRPSEPRDPKARAYSVAITRVDSATEQKVNTTLTIHRFGVDEAMPTLTIPLLKDEKTLLKLGEVYNYTFEAQRRWALEVDYARLPPSFETYSPADLQRIVDRMQKVHDKIGKSESTQHDESSQ